MAVFILDIEEDYDFDLIGISSHEKDYRLAWSLNRCMRWKMVRIDDILIHQKNEISRHAQFRFIHPVEQTIITLIDNKTPGGFFLPDVQQFDYVIKIENERYGCDDTFYKKLRSTPFVLTAYTLQIDKIKSKQNLLYEFR